jgi:L-seryl-tRNA(Ser) seleniumtransferase
MFDKLPSVHGLLTKLQKDFPELKASVLTAFIQSHVEEVRQNPVKYGLDKADKAGFQEEFYQRLQRLLSQILEGSLKKVINATGVVLHTNLGRAPLYEGIGRRWDKTLRYTNLELNLESGKRGQRNDHLNPLLQLLTGAERGLAVNNNAAAVMLMLNTTGKRKEVILSRGEMVEIGGSFRLPEVMKISGCKLKEVGTTNKTHLTDYEQAISAKTGAILICHSSNYEIRGFTSKPPLEKLLLWLISTKFP